MEDTTRYWFAFGVIRARETLLLRNIPQRFLRDATLIDVPQEETPNPTLYQFGRGDIARELRARDDD